MPSLPKIYLASSKPDKFDFLGTRCTMVEEVSEADYVVVDLVHPVKAHWISKTAHFRTPFLLTALGGPQDELSLRTFQEIFEHQPLVLLDTNAVDGQLDLYQVLAETSRRRNAMTLAEMRRGEVER